MFASEKCGLSSTHIKWNYSIMAQTGVSRAVWYRPRDSLSEYLYQSLRIEIVHIVGIQK